MKNNRTGVEITWKSKGYVFNEAQKSDLLAVAAQKREACTFARRESQEQASYRVKEQLAELIPMSIASPYLDRKGIAPRDGIFTDKEAMTTYIPAIDETGKCWTMQTIYEDGTKRFAKEGRKEGGFHAIGGLQAIASSPVIVIAEGYATAASLADVMGIPTIAAFDAGNLELVAGALHKQFPDKPIIVAGDDDKHLELTQCVNVGRDKATKAALAVNGTVVFPVFAPNEQTSDPKLFKDFNDLATKSVLGKEGVNRQLHRAIEQVRSSSVTIQAANHEIMPRSRAVSR